MGSTGMGPGARGIEAGPGEHSRSAARGERLWPALPVKEWEATRATLHMWTQMVGKVRMALSPKRNHWWEVALYVDARGLTTSPIPYPDGIFELRFDFISHRLTLESSNGATDSLRLEPRPVADFYADFMAMLARAGIQVKIWTMPVEIPDPIRFEQDRVHASYDPDYANRFWRILASVDTVAQEFRSGFIGKSSPVHFFWGSFDMAVTRFSGRLAPERPGADAMTREAYSHECLSAGFWPGSAASGSDAVFYAYSAPPPEGFAQSVVRPGKAFWSTQFSEFLLMYEDVRQAQSPEGTLLDFFQSAYDAGANLAKWDRASLERS